MSITSAALIQAYKESNETHAEFVTHIVNQRPTSRGQVYGMVISSYSALGVSMPEQGANPTSEQYALFRDAEAICDELGYAKP